MVILWKEETDRQTERETARDQFLRDDVWESLSSTLHWDGALFVMYVGLSCLLLVYISVCLIPWARAEAVGVCWWWWWWLENCVNTLFIPHPSPSVHWREKTDLLLWSTSPPVHFPRHFKNFLLLIHHQRGQDTRVAVERLRGGRIYAVWGILYSSLTDVWD